MYVRKINNKWQCQVRVGHTRKSKLFLSKKSASRWGVDILKKIHQGNNLEKIDTPLKDVIKVYIKQFTKHKKSAVRETLMWDRLIRDYPKLVNLKLSEIKPQHILDFKTKKSKDGKRITNYYLCLLNNLFKNVHLICLSKKLTDDVKLFYDNFFVLHPELKSFKL